MVSNARVKLSLQVTRCNFMNFFIFLQMMRRDMLLFDVQYGRLQLLELSTGDGYENGTQTWETGG